MPRTGPLLPHEPRIADPAAQQALTERFLLPAATGLEALFLALRAEVNDALAAAKPSKQGKPYPLGQCLEISRAVEDRLRRVEAASLAGPPAEGFAAIAEFMRHGGIMRKIWGDLRGDYFQNAFLLGTLYVDVANDTVIPTKPRVEILPFEQARLGAIEDFTHFAAVAGRYWKARVYPNHVLPALAPCFPLVSATPGSTVRLECMSVYMVSLTRTGAFRPSEAVLDAPPMDAALFRRIAECLAGSALEPAADPDAGRALALRACADQRAAGWHDSDDRRTAAVAAAIEANRHLEQLQVE